MTLQTPELSAVAESETGKPELAVATTTYGDPPTTMPDGGAEPKLIVCTLSECVGLPIANDCCTCAAARKPALPAWFASIVQVPLPTSFTVAPETVQMPALEGSAENATGRPEEAFADTAYVAPPTTAFAGGADVKAIVCIAGAGAGAGAGATGGVGGAAGGDVCGGWGAGCVCTGDGGVLPSETACAGVAGWVTGCADAGAGNAV